MDISELTAVLVTAGTLVLAGVTGWLAWSTRNLARHTDRMVEVTKDVAVATRESAGATKSVAEATAEMANATRAMLEVELERRSDETSAALRPVSLSLQGEGKGEFTVLVANEGAGVARDARVEMARKGDLFESNTVAIIPPNEDRRFRNFRPRSNPLTEDHVDGLNRGTKRAVVRALWLNDDGKPQNSRWESP